MEAEDKGAETFTLLLAMVLVELQNTCKKKVEQKSARKTQHMLFLKSWYSKFTCTCTHFLRKFSSFPSFTYHSQGHIWAKMAHNGPPVAPKT